MEYVSFALVAQAGSITDATPLLEVLVSVLNFLLSIALVVGIIGTVVAGVWYLTAGGDENRIKQAKVAAEACLIGTVVVLSALLVVNQIGTLLV